VIVDVRTARRRFATARSATLATNGPGGAHAVPIVFAVVGERIVTAIDHKPKRTKRLKRLANIAADARVAVLADHYDDDWQRLWWVRADGIAHTVEASAVPDQVDALVRKYGQYRERPPDGTIILIDVVDWRFWEAEARAAE
jgi:PPOX class probable F420-dependent enzyme